VLTYRVGDELPDGCATFRWGKPLQTSVHILDDEGNAARGCKGELCISGAAWGRGYLISAGPDGAEICPDAGSGDADVSHAISPILPDGAIESAVESTIRSNFMQRTSSRGKSTPALRESPGVREAVVLAAS